MPSPSIMRPLHECRFNRNSRNNDLTKPRDINELFNGFRGNAYAAIERAVEAVITELARVLSS